MSHILGYVGKINNEELQILYNQGYTNNSILGKSGIEKTYDNYLRGKDGIKLPYGRRPGEKYREGR